MRISRLDAAFTLVISATLAVTLGGCSSPSLTELPRGVHVSVQQNRPDSADHRLQVRFTNNSGAALTVTSLRFSSPVYSKGVDYPRAPSTVGAHSILDLPVILPAPTCTATDTTPTVTLGFRVGDHSGHVTLTPTDPIHQLPGLRTLDCLNDSMAHVATMTMPAKLRTEELSGKLVALIDVAITPTGSDGSYTIESVEDAILISPIAAPSPAPVKLLPLNLVIKGTDAPSTLTIPIVPIRCDDHGQADDKRGTLLPLHVMIGGTEAVSYLGVTEQLKAKIFEYLQSSCSYR